MAVAVSEAVGTAKTMFEQCDECAQPLLTDDELDTCMSRSMGCRARVHVDAAKG